MTTAAADPVFLDPNILVYASVDASPSYHATRDAITAYEASQTPLMQLMAVRPNRGHRP
jgi:hypothetical protein